MKQAALHSPALGAAASGPAVRVLRALVRGYQLLFSAWVGGQCRFYPTCSAYAIQALERHGAAVGTYLAAHRLCRCHPWCDGGLDEVPAHPPRLFALLHERRHTAGMPATPASPEFQPAARTGRKEAHR